jgi:thiamine-phosphate pyrophosphorylase
MDHSVARILDANANRTREGLRVAEDFARFDLQDAWLCDRIKSMRHALADALRTLDSRHLLRARDTMTDVGTTIETSAEYARSTTRDVVDAAIKRSSEGLRVLEEYAKLTCTDAARSVERLRYALYDVERDLAIRLDARSRFGEVKLYVIITESLCKKPWMETVEQAISGGADVIQLREKSLPDRELLERTKSLADVCRKSQTLLMVNDRPDIARLGGADGVHIGQDDVSVADARRIVGPAMIVGLSTHNIEQAREAYRQSPDYIATGPVFSTTTKPQKAVAGIEFFRGVCTETSLPVVPIGGIHDTNLDDVLSAGAKCVCVCSAVVSADDVAGATRVLKTRVTKASGTIAAAGGR